MFFTLAHSVQQKDLHSLHYWNTCWWHIVGGVNKDEGVDAEALGPQIEGQRAHQCSSTVKGHI